MRHWQAVQAKKAISLVDTLTHRLDENTWFSLEYEGISDRL
jgi:hypothetical protein